MSRAVDVLVVGAGPTGLALALQAHAHGAHVRIVEQRAEAFRPSRALILHPRTLEVLRPLGVTERLLAVANTSPTALLHAGRRTVLVRLGELALQDTAFPHLAFARQTDIEAVLAEALYERGVAVERGVRLIEARDGPERAEARLRVDEAEEQTDWDFIVGCDGPESAVRQCAGIGWQGRTYSEEVVLADLELDSTLAPDLAHVSARRSGLTLLLPIGERATWRLLATLPAGGGGLPFGRPGPPVPLERLQSVLDGAGLDARIRAVGWSARYGLQHRLAERFRRGRLFIAGDAAHTHSPATGQGMNTGIQDGINLGWKLAFSGAARDRDALLDSYESERRAVARRVLALTHVAFWAESSTALLPGVLRTAAVRAGAPALPLLLRWRRPIAEVMRVVSQLRVGYSNSPLSEDRQPRHRGAPRPGRRLPDASTHSSAGPGRVHELTAAPGIHVLAQRDAAISNDVDLGAFVSIHRLLDAPGIGVIAVRPDGYVGFRAGAASLEKIRAWLERVGAVQPDPPTGSSEHG